jgi:hypothetical protein
VNDPGKKYKKMYEILCKNESKSYHDKKYDNIYLQPSVMKEDLQTTDINSINANNGINSIKNVNNSSMKDELKNFLKNQLSPDHAGSTDLNSLSFQML